MHVHVHVRGMLRACLVVHMRGDGGLGARVRLQVGLGV